MNSDDANKFVFEIAKRLAARGNKIVSGFGWGVGSSVINGVLSHVYSTTGRLLDNHIVLRPFPQNISDTDERKQKWALYRKDMISQAGIAIFLFGNKKEGDNIVLSDGMREEFLIAKENKLIIIPILATDYMAKKIWSEIEQNLDEYYPSEELKSSIIIMNQLANNQIDALLNSVIDVVDKSQKLF